MGRFTMSESSVVSRIVHQSLVHQPSIMPEGPWWDHLESNFYARPEGFELEPWDWFRVSSTAAMDIALRTAAGSLLTTLAIPTGFNPITLKKAMDEKNMYEDIADARDPDKFFTPPPRDVPMKWRAPKTPHFKPEDAGICEDLTFESPFEPFNPRLRKSYMANTGNSRAIARFWHHGDKPRPTLVAVHGFMADPYWVNEWFFALPWMYHTLGCDVMLYILPFHGARQSKLSPFSGHGFFAHGISWMNEAFRQAVHDFRVFMNFLEDNMGVEKIGVTGVSLGGFTSALLASVEPRLHFAVPNVPVVSLPDIVLEWQPLGSLARAAMFAMRKSVKEMRHMLAVTCPLTYKPVLPKDRLMIIGGVGDRLAPPKHSRILWDHWGRPRIHWFPGNHILHLDKGAYLKEMARFMTDTGFLER